MKEGDPLRVAERGVPPTAKPVAARASSGECAPGVRNLGHPGELLRIHPVGAGREREHRPIVDDEHQRLHASGPRRTIASGGVDRGFVPAGKRWIAGSIPSA